MKKSRVATNKLKKEQSRGKDKRKETKRIEREKEGMRKEEMRDGWRVWQSDRLGRKKVYFTLVEKSIIRLRSPMT
jgi:hypothetical protein